MAKRKTYRRKKSRISEDIRWTDYDALKVQGKVLEAIKLKEKILNSYRWKKPCHHVAGEVN